MRFWCRCNELIEIDVINSSIIEFHWSKFISRCNELIEYRWSKQTHWNKRSETKRNSNFLFDVLNVDLFVWDNWCEIVVCDFYFSLYQTMFQRFKKMIIVKINWCRRTEKRSTIDWLTDSKNKKIDNWLINWLEEQKDRQLINWLTRRTRRSTIDCRCSKFIDWLISEQRDLWDAMQRYNIIT